jgi:hypothetical protein
MVTGGSGLHGVPVPEVVTKARKYAEENAIIRHHRMEESRVKDHQDIQLFACSHDAVLVSYIISYTYYLSMVRNLNLRHRI